jgi:hypothetical protein
MTLYNIEALDEEKKMVGSIPDGPPFESMSVVDKAFIVVMEYDFPIEHADRFKNHIQDTLRKALKDDEIEVLIIGGIDPEKIKFFRVTKNIPSKQKKKSLHSRKIKRRMKVDSNNTKKEDDKVVQKDQEEEKIQEEKTSRGSEESETGRFWPF